MVYVLHNYYWALENKSGSRKPNAISEIADEKQRQRYVASKIGRREAFLEDNIKL